MNIVCDKVLLSAAIDGVSKAVTMRSAIPVLEGILLKAEGFQLNLTGYDLEMGIVTTIEANVKEAGEVVLNAKLLSSMISRMPAGQVSILSAENGKTTIQSGVVQFEIQSMPANDFPELPNTGAEETLTIKTGVLKDMIDRTLYAVSQDEKKPAHTGELFEILPDKLTVVALDGLFVKPELPGKGNGSNADGTQAGDGIDYGDGVQPRVSGERKSKDYYTVLILGRDTGGGGNTDTMLLASYDVTNQKANVMSIPRDTMVNVNWDVKKINSVYNMNGGGEKGIKALYKEISQLVGFEPDYQVILEWEAVGKIVDAIGGVDFDVPYPMDYHDPAQNLVIEQAPGLRHLSGDDAMQVIRWRKNDSNSPYGNPQIGDSGRMQIQQDFLKAVIKQLLQLKNVVNPGKLAEVFRENVETDLSFENILWFGKQAVFGGLSLENVSFMTMPWTGVYVYSRTLSAEYGRTMKLDYVVPQANALLDLVNDSLSPFTEKFTLRDLDIMSVNADGSLASSTGRVEDSKAAAAPPVFVDPYTGRIANSSESTGGETEENDPPAEVTSGSLTVIGEATGNE